MTYCQLQQKIRFWIIGNSLYCQIDEVAMRSPLGRTLANAFLCHYEKEWLVSCPIELQELCLSYVSNFVGLGIVSNLLII